MLDNNGVLLIGKINGQAREGYLIDIQSTRGGKGQLEGCLLVDFDFWCPKDDV
jgi:hypothetical protein